MLKVTTKTIHQVSHQNFQKTVREVYGWDFSVPADQEQGNDTAITYSGMHQGPLLEGDIEDLEEFKKTGDYLFLTNTLLQDLINQDLAPEGDYVIEISW